MDYSSKCVITLFLFFYNTSNEYTCTFGLSMNSTKTGEKYNFVVTLIQKDSLCMPLFLYL